MIIPADRLMKHASGQFSAEISEIADCSGNGRLPADYLEVITEDGKSVRLNYAQTVRDADNDVQCWEYERKTFPTMKLTIFND